MRDVVWGGCYSVIRHALPRLAYGDEDITDVRVLEPGAVQFSFNMIAALMATVAAAPFNFVRNIQYGRLHEKNALKTGYLPKSLWREAGMSDIGRLRYLQKRMNIGWGTLRVGMGMGIGSQLYAYYMWHILE